MYLLTLLFGIACGWTACSKWGNHRAKYWYNQCHKVIKKAEAVYAANQQLLAVAERVQKYERNTSLEKMQVGLTEAITRMSEEGDANVA